MRKVRAVAVASALGLWQDKSHEAARALEKLTMRRRNTRIFAAPSPRLRSTVLALPVFRAFLIENALKTAVRETLIFSVGKVQGTHRAKLYRTYRKVDVGLATPRDGKRRLCSRRGNEAEPRAFSL